MIYISTAIQNDTLHNPFASHRLGLALRHFGPVREIALSICYASRYDNRRVSTQKGDGNVSSITIAIPSSLAINSTQQENETQG
jgi:hypothetical protein